MNLNPCRDAFVKLTAAYLQTLRPRAVKFVSGSERGLHQVIYPSGTRVWRYRYHLDGRPRHIRLGEAPAMRLDDARLEAMRLRDRVRAGDDPLAQREEELRQKRIERLSRITFEDLVTDYFGHEDREAVKGAAAYEAVVRRRFVVPWGKLQPGDITRAMVRAELVKIRKDGPVARNRALAYVRPVFNFAVRELELLQANPAAGIKMLPEKARERTLDAGELRALWHGAEASTLPPAVVRALQLILVTGQRPGEIGGLDLDHVVGDWWTIPETKNGAEQRVFLVGTAHQVIAEAKAVAVSTRYPFANQAGTALDSKQIGDETRKWVRSDECPVAQFTPHDLRRTMATALGRLEFDRFVQDRILNHKDRGIGATYDRHSYDSMKRGAWLAWERDLLATIGGAA